MLLRPLLGRVRRECLDLLAYPQGFAFELRELEFPGNVSTTSDIRCSFSSEAKFKTGNINTGIQERHIGCLPGF
jgi:hypothetical protein